MVGKQNVSAATCGRGCGRVRMRTRVCVDMLKPNSGERLTADPA